MGETADGDRPVPQVAALNSAVTARALARCRARGRKWAAMGVSLSGIWAVAAAARSWAVPELVDGAGVLGLTLLFVALTELWNLRAMRRILAARPWVAHQARSVPYRWSGAEAVVLRDPATGELSPLKITTNRRTLSAGFHGMNGVLWWCAEPGSPGVLMRPGSGELVRARPAPGADTRVRLARAAEARGLLPTPAPTQQRPVSQAASGPVPGPVPDAAVQEPRRRRVGVPGWIALAGAAILAGVVILALGIAASRAAERDPQIDLTVVAEQPDGHCTVRWADPWTHTTRTGSFRCDPDRGKELADWDTGWVVSYGPWKGELYNYERNGSPANQVDDILVLTGLLLTTGALVVAGVASVRRRRRRATPTRPAWKPATGVAARNETSHRPGPTYAALTEDAALRHTPVARRPEADIREVPWWRVRGLRSASGLPNATFLLLATAGQWLVYARSSDGLPVAAGGLTVLFALVLWRTCTRGIPSVRLIVRAARASVPVRKRYVLLPGTRSEGPLLVVFSLHGGNDDLPEGTLRLLKAATSKRKGQGMLPVDSVGVADLRGWVDADPPVVVPWIDGRAHWPADVYQELSRSEAIRLLL